MTVDIMRTSNGLRSVSNMIETGWMKLKKALSS